MNTNDILRADLKAGLIEVDFEGGGTGKLRFSVNGTVATLDHSEVPAQMRGKGLGARLMAASLPWFESQKFTVNPVCPYTALYIRRNPQWAHLLAA